MLSSLIKTNLGKFRIIAFLEGLSYLSLAITMYFKYALDLGLPNKIVGMFHGLLFLLYVAMALYLFKKLHWSKTKLALILLASIIPFGTFYMDHRYFKNH